MLNPVLTPEQVLAIKQREPIDFDDAKDQIAEIEAQAMYDHKSCNALSISERELDLDSEANAKHEAAVQRYLDKYQPNDGTSAFERRLRRQGLRKKDDEEWPRHNLFVEVYDTTSRRAKRVNVVREKHGDIFIN